MLKVEQSKNSLANRDLLSINDLDKQEIIDITRLAASFEKSIKKGRRLNILENKILSTLFYEPSTRTRFSFESAMYKLGGKVLSAAEAQTTSSAVKGETLSDNGRMIGNYADIVAVRHPSAGSAGELASSASIPVINAGDGTNEHPTQALLDLFTIIKEKQKIDGLTIALLGDLKNGRTVHSLSQSLSLWDVNLIFVSPPELRMPQKIRKKLSDRGTHFLQSAKIEDILPDCDILYVTRIQKERFKNLTKYERLRGSYGVNKKLIESLNPNLSIMHPLPRIQGPDREIHEDVDDLPGAAYFRQAANGVPVRMALLSMLLGGV